MHTYGWVLPVSTIYSNTSASFFEDVNKNANGVTIPATVPFEGVLADSNARIGRVSVDNFPVAPSFPTRMVIGSDGTPLPVRIVGSDVSLGGGSSFSGVLAAGSAHVGSVSVDGPISLAAGTQVGITGLVGIAGTVTVAPHAVTISNFPSVQTVQVSNALNVNPHAVTISGTPSVEVSNHPTESRINNRVGDPVLVKIVASDVSLGEGGGSGTGGGTSFDGIIRNTTNQAVPVSLPSNTSVGISGIVSVAPHAVTVSNFPATTNVAGTVAISGTVSTAVTSLPAINGTVSISNFPAPVTSVSVSNLPATQAVSGTVTVSNPVTSVSINNPNSAPVPVSIQGGVSTFDGVLKGGTAHVGSVSVDAPVSVDSSTPLNVFVTNPSTGGGGGSSFDGVLAAGSAHVGSVGVDGTVNVAGTVTVSNFPAPVDTQKVSIANAVTVNGTVTANVTFPATQPVSGTVALSGTPTVNIQQGGAGINKNNPLATTLVFDSQTVGATSPLPVGLTGFDGSTKVTNSNPFPVLVSALKAVAIEGPNGNKVTAANAFPVSIGNTVNVAGTVSATITNTTPLDVNIVGGSAGGSSFNGVLANSTATIGTVKVDTTTPLQVTITNPSTGGGGGGTTFDGQLRQNGNAVSAANALPVLQAGQVIFNDASGVFPASSSYTSPARANPGPGLVFIARMTISSQASVFRVEQSMDGTNWNIFRTQAANSAGTYSIATDAVANFYRVVFANATQAQTAAFILTTSFTTSSVDAPVTLTGSLPAGTATIGAVNIVNGTYWSESTTPMAAGGIFTGTGRNTTNTSGSPLNVTTFAVNVFSDAAGTFRIESSPNNTVWYRASADIPIAAGTFLTTSVPALASYLRVIFTNGATAQTSFFLTSATSKLGPFV